MTSRSSVRLSLRTPSSNASRPRSRAPWWVFGAVGAAAIGFGGWIVMAGFSVLGWLAGTSGTLTSAVGTGTRLWLLAHGAPVEFGLIRISLIPLLPTLIIGLCCAGVARKTSSQARFLDPDAAPLQTLWRSTLLTAGAYVVIVVVVATFMVAPNDAGRALVTTSFVAGIGSFWGAMRGSRIRPSTRWPLWARAIPRAVGMALLVVGAFSVVALVWTMINHKHEMNTIQAALAPGATGGISLFMLQLAYAPTLLIWTAAYILGAGFLLGDGSVVSIANTHVGFLPSLPIFGAVPVTSGRWYQYLWLLAGVAAGAASAWVVLRARRRAEVTETGLVGGLVGVLSAVVITVFAALTRGGLGVHRLAQMGPRMTELLLISSALLGLSGAVAGIVMGLLSPPGKRDGGVD